MKFIENIYEWKLKQIKKIEKEIRVLSEDLSKTSDKHDLESLENFSFNS